MNIINIIGAASGVGAKVTETEFGPSYIKSSSLMKSLIDSDQRLRWKDIISINSDWRKYQDKVQLISSFSQLLAKQTYSAINNSESFVVIGGDHSCAIGTWSGVASQRRSSGDIGLIWVDAHLDGHTFDTSISKAIHGMPVACLLGYGKNSFTQILDPEAKIKPQYLSIIGARSYEEGEHELLNKLGVRIFFIDEVKQRGLKAVFEEAIKIAKAASGGFGVSIDLDAIDPKDAPGTGSPEPNGLLAKELLENLTNLNLASSNNHNFLGLEIAEFNPLRDQKQITERLICDIIRAVFGIIPNPIYNRLF